MRGESARRENLLLPGCPNRSAFPGLKLQYHLADVQHTPFTSPDVKVQTPREWSTERIEPIRTDSYALWKTGSV